MSTQTANYPEVIDQLPPGSTLVLHDISWDEYEELLEAVGEPKGLHISLRRRDAANHGPLSTSRKLSVSHQSFG